MGKMADNVQLKDYRFIFGEPKTREEVIGQLQSEEQLWRTFCELTVSYQEEIIAFCMGNQGIKITYDSVLCLNTFLIQRQNRSVCLIC